MAYQALLFCPEEKTARTVTQVLTELEFSVDPCTEPFAAVKKLMSQHFDAIVVDCDNEQNATLLFKSARNSTSNQASLAVAIVEGQAGVAKAFRIGANLVLTKPINVEQSKGTLRVARGLLRKGEAPKPATTSVPISPVPSAATPAAVPTKPLATQAMPAAKPAAPTTTGVRSAPTPRPAANPPARPATPADATAESTTSSSAFTPKSSFGATSAASAPAPAREPQVAAPSAAAPAFEPEFDAEFKSTTKTSETLKQEELKASVVEVAHSAASSTEPAAPSFTFGGVNVAEPASGAGKKAILGLVAAIAIAAAAYGGWSYFGHRSEPAPQSTVPAAITPKPASQPVKPSQPEATAAAPKPDTTVAAEIHTSATEGNDEFPEEKPEKSAHAGKTPAKPSAQASSPSETASKETSPSDDVAEAAAPLVVKSGSQPRHHAASTDAPAPSMIGMAAPASATPIAGIVADQPTATPVLQRLKVSQGVAQGLIVKRVSPEYPRNAMTMRIEGPVDLVATISKDGDIKDVKVLKGDSQLSRAAVLAVKQWKYKPYLLNGEPVEIQTQITIDFKLPQ